MTPQITEGPLDTARLRLHHLRTRPGNARAPRVLLLGGSNFDLRLKRAFLDTPLARDCALVTYEPRGIGRSARPDGTWRMSDYAEDALSVLDALGWDDAVIVGESFGGMTALHLALMAPRRVRRIVTASAGAGGPAHPSVDISAFLDLSREQAAEQALCLQDTRNIALRDTNPSLFADRLADRIRFEIAFAEPSIANGGYARLLAARRSHDCSDALARITIPAMVIAGRFDGQSPPEAQEALCRGLPDACFRAYDAGHGVLFSAPGAIQEVMTFIGTADMQARQNEETGTQ